MDEYNRQQIDDIFDCGTTQHIANSAHNQLGT